MPEIAEDLQIFEERIAHNADTLIALGKAAWKKNRKRNTRVGQEEQLRRIEESLVNDAAGR